MQLVQAEHSGISKYLKECGEKIQIGLADPEGSSFLITILRRIVFWGSSISRNRTGTHYQNLELAVIDDCFQISDRGSSFNF